MILTVIKKNTPIHAYRVHGIVGRILLDWTPYHTLWQTFL